MSGLSGPTLNKYIRGIEQIGYDAIKSGLIPVDGDTFQGAESLRATLLAAGAGCQELTA